jgi:hypothetical protein
MHFIVLSMTMSQFRELAVTSLALSSDRKASEPGEPFAARRALAQAQRAGQANVCLALFMIGCLLRLQSATSFYVSSQSRRVFRAC